MRRIKCCNGKRRGEEERTGGVALAQLAESVTGYGTTAHPLGGAVIGSCAADGVVDADHRVFGYENLLVCDGSVVPVNLGTNPSLTITALTELAMSRIPPAWVRGTIRPA